MATCLEGLCPDGGASPKTEAAQSPDRIAAVFVSRQAVQTRPWPVSVPLVICRSLDYTRRAEFGGKRVAMAKQRILLVDDHEVVRLGLKSLLDRHALFEVVGEAASAREALEQVALLEPDVVVMDIRLPGTSGIEACEEIVARYPKTKVIMLTSYAEDEMLFSAIRSGASGYILKQIGSDDLIKALEAVSRGEALLDPAVTQRVFQEVRRAVKEEEASAFAHLSQQEKHVLLLVSEGKTNREIAKALFLGEGTVRNYVSSILSKLGVNNRAEAAAYAVEHNLREYISI